MSKETPVNKPVETRLGLVERGLVRLARVRYAFHNETIGLDEVKGLYQTWVNQDEGLVLQLQYGSDRDFEKKTIGVKCSKRGNDVYRWRSKGRISKLDSVIDEFDPKLGKTTNVLFVTLTDNPVLRIDREAWERIGERWNRFLSNIKKRYGRVEFVRSFESTKKGRPHIHAQLIFKDAIFHTFEDPEGRLRVEEKEGIARFWDSFVDVQSPRTKSAVLDYIVKEVFKHAVDQQEDQTTLSLLWLYRKRSFSISRGFSRSIARLDRLMHNSNQKLRALDLFGLPIDDMRGAKWVCLGVFPWSRILECRKDEDRSPENLWSYELISPPKERS